MQLVSGVCNAGDVLGLFTLSRPEWGAADVSRALGLSRSHTHRLLSSLSHVGLLDRLEPSGRFRLSWSWLTYASIVRSSDRLVNAAIPIMRNLHAAYGLRPALAIWRQDAVVSLEPTAEPVVTRASFDECTAVGFVLLAGLPEQKVDAFIGRVDARSGQNHRDQLDARLRHIRKGGLVVQSGRHDSDGQCAVTPVRDEQGSIVAALGVHARQGFHAPTQSDGQLLMKAAVKMTKTLRDNRLDRSGQPVSPL
ncbi:helix-turn-helix domain-containing protein [Agromyces sp. ISL-38]|uniref:IclR family transcriptional regulator n=1 Tax=Agromyces sp. ISL-38 TaxID=2819107 RepID=UPI001BE99ADF|nr:helix-turn-helix domain-containing protein [Agromyces sp. ISL-38]